MSHVAPELYMVYQTNPFIDGQGGGVRYVRNLVSALEKKGAKITFLGVGGEPREEGNIRFIPLMRHSNSALLFMLALFWARFRYLGNSDAVVHVHRLYYALPFLGRRIKCVATLHGRTFSVFPQRFGKILSKLVFPVFRFLERKMLGWTDCIVAVSVDVVEQFGIRHGAAMERQEVRIISSMVDLPIFYPRESSFFENRFGASPVCLFVGRLAAVKNVPLLLESWKIVTERRPDAKLVLVGDGEMREQIRAQIMKMKLGTSVTMIGELSPGIVPDAISASHLLVMTSHHEAAPTVVKEALSSGVPVVSTPVGDVRSVIEEGRTGRIVPPNPASIAAAILDVLDWNRPPEEVANAARPALAQCSPEATASAYLQIYRSLGCQIDCECMVPDA